MPSSAPSLQHVLQMVDHAVVVGGRDAEPEVRRMERRAVVVLGPAEQSAEEEHLVPLGAGDIDAGEVGRQMRVSKDAGIELVHRADGFDAAQRS